ncbi:MAG: MarR family transcriptional regulator [Actinomycetota bacterium]|nr:MarR family transcriptional regulator [Actinomycetota bacterium]
MKSTRCGPVSGAGDGDETDRGTEAADSGGRRQAPLQRALQDLRIELSILTERVAALAGLNPRDLDVLDLIAHEGPFTPTALAARTGLRAATLTGALARLERDGWVTRAPNPGDRRSALVGVTSRVRELDRLYGAGDALLGQVLTGLPSTDALVVESFLGDVRAAVREAASGL